MNKYEQLCIEMKYEGKSYKEMVDVCKGVISLPTLHNWFQKGGRLHEEYVHYSQQMNERKKDEAYEILKKEVANASKVIIQALADALERKNYPKAVEYAEKILDRAGMVVVREGRIEVDQVKRKKVETYDDFIRELNGLGIDPATGLRVETVEMEQDSKLLN